MASLTPLATSSGLFTARPPTSRITSPDLMPFWAASEAAVHVGDDHAVLVGAGAGATRQPELVHLGAPAASGLLGSDLGQLLAGRELAELDRNGLLLLAAQDACTSTLVPGEKPAIWRARSRLSATLLPLTDRIASPFFRPASAAGPGGGHLGDQRALGLGQARGSRPCPRRRSGS